MNTKREENNKSNENFKDESMLTEMKSTLHRLTNIFEIINNKNKFNECEDESAEIIQSKHRAKKIE